MASRIYLDNNATSFLDPRIKETLLSSLQNIQGNPSSLHSFGQDAKKALAKARKSVADSLQASPSEILFHSGGTEGLNTLIQGFIDLYPGAHIITSSVEHSAVYAPLKRKEMQGTNISFLNPGLYGAITPDSIEKAITPSTKLIVLMAVNNETGVKTDIEALAEIAKKNKIHFIVDGVALMGKEKFSLPAGVSAMCFSGHKFHALKGSGFTFIRKTLKIPPFILGGEQEHGKRGGTENLLGILSIAEAIKLLDSELPNAALKMTSLRDKLEHSLLLMPGVKINGLGPRVTNTSNLSFEGVEGETLLVRLDLAGIAVSHGSACSSGAIEPSRVLLNMGISKKMAATSIRISLSRFTTVEEIDQTIETIQKIVPTLRKGYFK